jgi:GTP-binding protein EngB required for normal cell division
MLLPSCITRVPLLFALSVARRRVGSPYATLAGTTESDPSLHSEKAEDDFLVRNNRNEVQLLQCPSMAVLRQGLLETSGLPHICVAGESNTGKSSMINHLLKKKLAKASSVAGKTRSVDMMLVNHKLVLTDLPGLPSRDHQVEKIWASTWEPLVLSYVRECEPLRAMLYAHDIRWKVSPQVRSFLSTVQEAGLPVVLVLTKDDKLALEEDDRVPEHERRRRLTTSIRKSLDFGGLHLHYSCESSLASSRRARRSLLRLIEDLVAEEGGREACMQMLDQRAARKQGRDPAGDE